MSPSLYAEGETSIFALCGVVVGFVDGFVRKACSATGGDSGRSAGLLWNDGELRMPTHPTLNR